MIPTFARLIADPVDQPRAAYRALEWLARQTIGADLFTVTLHDPARGVARRSHTSDPDAYPVSGEKPLNDDRWSAQVIGRHEMFVANSVEEFADVFPDHELIRSLGCESCLNIPVVVAGEVLGTMNCLSGPGHYTPERLAAAETLKLPAAAVLLMARMMEDAARKGGRA